MDLPDEGDLLNTIAPPGSSIESLGCVNDGKSWRAIDRTTSHYSCTRDVNVTQSIIIAPNTGGRKSILTAMRLYPSSRSETQNPLSYILSGRADAESPWVFMIDGEFPGVREGLSRNPGSVEINSTFESGDANLVYSEVGLPHNGDAYLDYKIEFTAMKGGSSTTYLRFAELELPGHLEASLSPTLSPSISPTKSVSVLHNKRYCHFSYSVTDILWRLRPPADQLANCEFVTDLQNFLLVTPGSNNYLL